MPTVVLIEDDPVLAATMTTHLEHAGFEVHHAHDGERGLQLIRYRRPDVAVIDLMLPGVDGWTVTQAIREDHRGMPVIIISARSSESDKVRTLELGADDYLGKPFGMRELIARIEALLRRSHSLARESPSLLDLKVEGLRIDTDLRAVFVRTAPVQPERDWVDAQLTGTELRLLLALARAQGVVQSRDDLQRRVWGTPYRYRDRGVDVCIRKIRAKVDRRSPTHCYIHTHYGIGYRFDAEPH